MVPVITATDAYLAEDARQELDGSLYVEGAHLSRIQIDPDGKARIVLVVHHRRPKAGGPSSIEVDVVYPWGGREKLTGLDVPPQQFDGQEGFVFFKGPVEAPTEGDYKLAVKDSWGDEITVPVTLFK
jgi:hypothetical protein